MFIQSSFLLISFVVLTNSIDDGFVNSAHKDVDSDGVFNNNEKLPEMIFEDASDDHDSNVTLSTITHHSNNSSSSSKKADPVVKYIHQITVKTPTTPSYFNDNLNKSPSPVNLTSSPQSSFNKSSISFHPSTEKIHNSNGTKVVTSKPLIWPSTKSINASNIILSTTLPPSFNKSVYHSLAGRIQSFNTTTTVVSKSIVSNITVPFANSGRTTKGPILPTVPSTEELPRPIVPIFKDRSFYAPIIKESHLEKNDSHHYFPSNHTDPTTTVKPSDHGNNSTPRLLINTFLITIVIMISIII